MVSTPPIIMGGLNLKNFSYICGGDKPHMRGVILQIRVSTPPQKHTPFFLANVPPLKSAKCPSFSSFTPYYLLKVTKILVDISQFNFLVVTEKNVFAYKLFSH